MRFGKAIQKRIFALKHAHDGGVQFAFDLANHAKEKRVRKGNDVGLLMTFQKVFQLGG